MDLAAPVTFGPTEPRAPSAHRRPATARDAFAPHALRASDLIGAAPPPPFSAVIGGSA